MNPSRAKKIAVSIVIRSFNEEQHLGNLLKSIAQQNFRDFEVVLVDSGSTDQTLQIAKQYSVRIENILPKEFTFGRSLNQGIRVSRGEIVVIASAHVLPLSENWLTAIVEPFDDKLVAMSYGKQRGGKGSQYSENQHWRNWFPEQSDLDQSSNFSNNANSAIRRNIWEIQPFDEDLTGLEDIAWSSWAKSKEYKIAYVAEAEVAHLHGESADQIINRYQREAFALKQILPESRFTFWHFLTHFTRKSIEDIVQARSEGKLFKTFFSILGYRRRQYWGTYLGYRKNVSLGADDKMKFYYPPASLEPKQNEKKKKAVGEVQS
jgi:glycosyltransferase involved in cell wall biosynthesis